MKVYYFDIYSGLDISLFSPDHPVDLFMLFKHWSRLNTSRPEVQGKLLVNEFSFSHLLNIWTDLLPSEQDFKQIAYNLIRLEEVYGLDFTQTVSTQSELSPALELGLEDFISLGKVAFENLNLKQFHSW